MSRKVFTLLVVASTVALVGVAMLAQMPGARAYDPKAETTVTGVVEEVRLTSFGRGRMGGGVHLTLKTEKETLDVHLGPQFYLEEREFEVEAGQEAEVIGSRVTESGKPALIAREIKVNETRLTLREPDGHPLWAQGPGTGGADSPRTCRGGCCGGGCGGGGCGGECCGHRRGRR